jgi:hypothetical protein
MLKGTKEGKVILPIDPDTGKPVMELMMFVRSKDEEDKLYKELEVLGYRFVALRTNPYINNHSFRQLWQHFLSNHIVSNITNNINKRINK